MFVVVDRGLLKGIGASCGINVLKQRIDTPQPLRLDQVGLLAGIPSFEVDVREKDISSKDQGRDLRISRQYP